MKTVILPARPGQGSAPSCTCAPFQPHIPPEPAPSEVRQPEEANELEGLAPPEAASSLLLDRGLPQLQPPPRLAVEPRAGHTLEETLLRSLSRRAVRAVRPFIQSGSQQQLWVVGYDESCRPVGFQRLVLGAQDASLASPLLVLGWAEAAGARAMVLVQNQPCARHEATAVDLVPTLKLATAATLFGLVLVDHVVLYNVGAPSLLGPRSVLTDCQALAADLCTTVEALASAQPGFGVPRGREGAGMPR